MIDFELHEDLAGHPPVVVITRGAGEDVGAWARLQESLQEGIQGGDKDLMEVRAEVFFAELGILQSIRLVHSTAFQFGDALKNRLRSVAEERRAREVAAGLELEALPDLRGELSAAGFKRELKAFQKENLQRLCALPHGADFSVPGAGKTTVALANFAIQRVRGGVRQMLVVAPLSAFSAWKNDAQDCFAVPPLIHVHTDRAVPVPANTDIVLTNYHRLASDYGMMRAWAIKAPTQVLLDEAHRIKRGRAGVHGRAALDLAFTAVRRDVLTGTPFPQGAYDIAPLIGFLYPGEARRLLPRDVFVERLNRDPATLNAAHRALRGHFVRTRKHDLGLPPTRMGVVRKPMGQVQEAIYAALIGEYRGRFQLADTSRRNLRRLGRIVIYLLEAATNPLLLPYGSDTNDLPSFEHPPLKLQGTERLTELLEEYAEFETPWKYQEAARIVEQGSLKGEKVIIWTSFVRNIRYLQEFLSQWEPAVVHGGIPPKDGASPRAPTTREDELNRFRHMDRCSVLLANPAACGEGVSLHDCCHHAVYLDRTFNAGHFLQSQDRIHRLGLSSGTLTRFTILVSEGSIDDSVDLRLQEKVSALAQLMDDPNLVRVSLPTDEMDKADEEEARVPLAGQVDGDDEKALLQHVDSYGK